MCTDGKEFYRFEFAFDYASGKNSLGGGGVGLSYFFTKDVFIQTGPVWFNSKRANGPWKWLLELSVNAPTLF
jgi:hypothetical protein